MSSQILEALSKEEQPEEIVTKEQARTVHDLLEHNTPLPANVYKKPYNKLRRAKLILFSNGFATYESFNNLSYEEQVQILIKLEKACLNHTITKAKNNNVVPSWKDSLFQDLYNSICYKVSSNIEPKNIVNNTQLAEMIIAGDVDISKVPKMSSQEMCPQKYEKIFQRINASRSAKATLKVTEMYTCGRCKEKKCTMENVYNRSLDEGVNLRITCMNCGFAFNA